MSEPEFYPDIHEYLESTDNSKSVSIKHVEEIAYYIRAHTDLSIDASKLLLKYFFQEVRSNMMKGNVVILRRFGKFFISSPRVTGNKERVFPKFEPSAELIDAINQ